MKTKSNFKSKREEEIQFIKEEFSIAELEMLLNDLNLKISEIENSSGLVPRNIEIIYDNLSLIIVDNYGNTYPTKTIAYLWKNKKYNRCIWKEKPRYNGAVLDLAKEVFDDLKRVYDDYQQEQKIINVNIDLVFDAEKFETSLKEGLSQFVGKKITPELKEAIKKTIEECAKELLIIK